MRARKCLYLTTNILNIIGILLTAALVFFGSIVTYRLQKIEQTFKWRNHDLSILQEFQRTFYTKDKQTRPLAMLYLNLLDDSETKWRVTERVTWILLKDLIKNPSYLTKKEKYKFDRHNDDTYYLAGNFEELFSLSEGKATKLFLELIDEGPEIYNDYLLPGKCHNIDNPILDRKYVNTSITRIRNSGESILVIDTVKR